MNDKATCEIYIKDSIWERIPLVVSFDKEDNGEDQDVNAANYAERIMTNGFRYKNSNTHWIFYPPHRIHEVNIKMIKGDLITMPINSV